MGVQFIAVSVDRNVMFWIKKNPHYMVEWEHNPPHVKLWAGMTATQLSGPCFFSGPVKATSYTKMLEAQWRPQLRDRGLVKMHGCSTMENLHILAPTVGDILNNIIWTAELSVSPANLHSTKFSIIITWGRYNRPISGAMPSGPRWSPLPTKRIWTAGLAVIHQHLPSHYPGHHSHDLTTPDNSLWGVTAHRYHNNDILRRAME
jgi:hypothetical protein